MALTPSGLVGALLAGALYSLLTARPGRKLGFLDGNLQGRERWAYFTFSFLVSSSGYALLSALTSGHSVVWLILGLLPLTLVVTFLQTVYYLFLAEGDNAHGDPT